MSVIFISPTEPKQVRELGITSGITEEYGADIMWWAGLEKYGVQRKEFPNDFLDSLHDGRLAEQLAKGKPLDCMILILEGRATWTNEGKLLRGNGKRWPYDRSQHRRLCATIQSRGVQIHYSDGISDTIELVKDLAIWSEKESHTSLDRTRVPPNKDKWGKRSNITWQKHFLQGLPDIGPKQASNIIDTIGFPLSINVTRETLMSVPGIGKVTADKILKVFGDGPRS